MTLVKEELCKKKPGFFNELLYIIPYLFRLFDKDYFFISCIVNSSYFRYLLAAYEEKSHTKK